MSHLTSKCWNIDGFVLRLWLSNVEYLWTNHEMKMLMDHVDETQEYLKTHQQIRCFWAAHSFGVTGIRRHRMLLCLRILVTPEHLHCLWNLVLSLCAKACYLSQAEHPEHEPNFRHRTTPLACEVALPLDMAQVQRRDSWNNHLRHNIQAVTSAL